MTLERTGTPHSTPMKESTVTPPGARQQVDNDGSPRLTPAKRDRRKLHQLSLVVLVVGLVVTGVLTASSRLGYLHTEQRLSNLQTNLTASALGIAPADLERLLGQAAAASGEASDPVATFRRVIAPSIAPAGPFATASLALVRSGNVQVLAHVGAKPINSPTGNAASALFEQAAKSASLVTTRVVGKGLQRFGYLMSFVGPGGTYVVPPVRRCQAIAGSPFRQIRPTQASISRSTSVKRRVQLHLLRLPSRTLRSPVRSRRPSCLSGPAP